MIAEPRVPVKKRVLCVGSLFFLRVQHRQSRVGSPIYVSSVPGGVGSSKKKAKSPSGVSVWLLAVLAWNPSTYSTTRDISKVKIDEKKKETVN